MYESDVFCMPLTCFDVSKQFIAIGAGMSLLVLNNILELYTRLDFSVPIRNVQFYGNQVIILASGVTVFDLQLFSRRTLPLLEY